MVAVWGEGDERGIEKAKALHLCGAFVMKEQLLVAVEATSNLVIDRVESNTMHGT